MSPMPRCITRPKGRVRIETVAMRVLSELSTCITRPKGRVRIETCQASHQAAGTLRITRPKGRVRIETSMDCCSFHSVAASPGRKAGCGLKLSNDFLFVR